MTVNPDTDIQDVINLSSLEAVRVISDSQRHQLFSALVPHEKTVRELSTELGISRTRLYYHLKLLLDHGLIRVVSERLVNGIVEKTYRSCARSLRVYRSVLSANESESESGIADVQAAVMEQTAQDLRSRAAQAAASDENIFVTRTFLRISPSRHAELRERLRALIEAYRSAPDADGIDVELAMALFSL